MDVILVALKLSAPKATEINVNFTVSIITESTHIDAVTSGYRCRIRYERALRTLSDGCTPMEHIVAVLHGEVHDVTLNFLAETHTLRLLLSIGGDFNFILLDITVPKLATCPWNILQAYHLAVVNNLTVHDVICGKDVIILHHVLVTVVVLNVLTLPVMRRIDVNPAVKHMYRGICHVICGEKITLLHKFFG
jgi:hypothetical protein